MPWYTTADGEFFSTRQGFDRMKPDFYEVVADGRGNYGLKTLALGCDDLIDLPGTVVDECYDDIMSFMEHKERYRRLGLTHKRGYLFYGTPGGGKTSAGILLSRKFIQRDGIVVFTSNPYEFSGIFDTIRSTEPERDTLFLIEEADEIIDNSECLSLLDGEKSMSGTVFVAMTNYVGKLPPRITNRPGRFDRVIEISCTPPAVQLEYLARIQMRDGLAGGDVAKRIVAELEGLPITLAHLREAYITHVLMGQKLSTVKSRFKKMLKQDAGG